MLALLRLLPGAAQGLAVIKTLGLSEEEISASNKLLAVIRSLPFFRQLPPELLPATLSDAIGWGVTASANAGLRINPKVREFLSHPTVAKTIATEVAALVSPEDQVHLVSGASKALDVLGKQADVPRDDFVKFVSEGLIPAVVRQNESQDTDLMVCPACGSVSAVPPFVQSHSCYKCGHVKEISR